MQIRKTRAIGADGEQRAIAPSAAQICRSIQGGARQYQTGVRESAVGVDPRSIATANDIREIMQTRIAIARAVEVDSVHRATVACLVVARRRAIKGVAGKNQSVKRGI